LEEKEIPFFYFSADGEAHCPKCGALNAGALCRRCDQQYANNKHLANGMPALDYLDAIGFMDLRTTNELAQWRAGFFKGE